MKRFFFSFLLGVAAGVAGYWYFQEGRGKQDFQQARNKIIAGTEKAKEAAVEQFDPDTIKKELSRTGQVVREKAKETGISIAAAAANATTTATIKAKFLAEPGLSALSINVDTDGGTVTLSGTVSSPEQIGRAIKLALETDGVQKVVSKLQISSAK
jgi:osmotically-inducible protein OsmY